MKQYTTPDQTAKLIELGFENPKSERLINDVANQVSPEIKCLVRRRDYSIGELIEMLPPYINDEEDEDNVFELTIFRSTKWTVSYGGIFELKIGVTENELIDAIFFMIIKLKEEGVI